MGTTLEGGADRGVLGEGLGRDEELLGHHQGVQRRGDNVNAFKDLCLQNGSNKGQNVALTVLCVLSLALTILCVALTGPDCLMCA